MEGQATTPRKYAIIVCMETSPNHRTILLCVLCAVTVGFTTMAQEQSLLPLAPEYREQVIAGAFIETLEKRHMLRPTLGQSHSKEAFRLYIRKLDPRKLYFYQSDIDEFKAKYESQLIELLKQSPAEVRPAFEIYNRYLKRLRERGGMIPQILATPMNFTIDEEYVFDSPKDFTLDEETIKAKGLQTFPRTTEEAYDRWRKRLKSELLALMLDTDDRDPVERLKNRYAGLQRRTLYERPIDNAETLKYVRLQANDKVMGLFLTAITESFDPHSSYILDTMVKPSQGIGAMLGAEDGSIFVRELVRGGTADKSRELLPGDKIRGVGQGKDGKIEDVVYCDVTDVVQLVRGPKETVVRLEILPGGRGPAKIIELVRDRITPDDEALQSKIFEVARKRRELPIESVSLTCLFFTSIGRLSGIWRLRDGCGGANLILPEVLPPMYEKYFGTSLQRMSIPLFSICGTTTAVLLQRRFRFPGFFLGQEWFSKQKTTIPFPK